MDIMEISLTVFKFGLLFAGSGFVLAILALVVGGICLVPLAMRAKTNAIDKINYQLAVDGVGHVVANIIWYSLYPLVIGLVSGVFYVLARIFI